MDSDSIAHLCDELRAHLAPDDDHDGIWPENFDTLRAFLCVQTQWRTATIGGGFGPSKVIWLGLDYAAVRISLDALKIEITTDLWLGLQIMEAEASKALNEG